MPFFNKTVESLDNLLSRRCIFIQPLGQWNCVVNVVFLFVLFWTCPFELIASVRQPAVTSEQMRSTTDLNSNTSPKRLTPYELLNFIEQLLGGFRMAEIPIPKRSCVSKKCMAFIFNND